MTGRKATISFIILVALAAIATFAAIYATKNISEPIENSSLENSVLEENRLQNIQPTAAELDVSTWKSYTDKNYFLSFKYPSTWQVKTYQNRNGFDIIVLEPNNARDNIRIYVSPENYFALQGLPSKKGSVAGIQSINVNDMVVGVKYAAQYYTFDMGTDPKLKTQFQSFLGTVAFSR